MGAPTEGMTSSSGHTMLLQWQFLLLLGRAAALEIPSDSAKAGTIHYTPICYNCRLQCLLLTYTPNETFPHGTNTIEYPPRREDLLPAALCSALIGGCLEAEALDSVLGLYCKGDNELSSHFLEGTVCAFNKGWSSSSEYGDDRGGVGMLHR